MRHIRRDRRGATAVIIALMSLPMLIASGAAVDFSRIAAVRAQLQSAADAASLAGAGAFQTNQDGTAAYNVASAAFNAAATSLSAYASVTSTVGTSCNPAGASGITCGTVSASNGASSLCPAATIYCVEVTAQATLQNSLLGFLIPKDVLNVTAVAQSLGGVNVSAGNFSNTVYTYGSDLKNLYVHSVPLDSAGNPEYGVISPPNSYCSDSSYGVLHYEATVTAGNGVTACNYVLIGSSSGASSAASLNASSSDPLAFTFASFAGGNLAATATGDLDTTTFVALTGTSIINSTATPYTAELYVTSGGTTNYYANGKTVGLTALYGNCPAHNLYGAINAYPNPASDIVPYQDSIVNFDTSWELLGWPPTHGANHALLPFLGPTNTQTVSGTTYKVQAICPQWPVTGTNILATASFSPSNLPSSYAPVTSVTGYPTASNVKVYATYFPDIPYTASNGTYPPAIAGCSPAYNTTDGGVTPLLDDPWWGWSPNNALRLDPGGAAENPGGLPETDCTMATLNSAGVLVVAALNNLQSPGYDNCAFLIQPLGTSVPTTNGVPELPDYYTYTVSLLGFILGTTGNASSIISSQTAPLYGMTPVYDGVGNSHAAGYVPTSVSISGPLLGPYVITEPPAFGHDNYPPEDTAHQCYDPQANSINGALLPGSDQPNNDSPVIPIDPVANPEYGAIFCNTNPPPNYALYWNDMGSYAEPARFDDDLGYNNAITEFTCPLPTSPGATGPPTLIY